MTLEELKALLESGAITQEQYDAMAQALEGKKDPEPPKDPDPKEKGLEELISRAVDRATNKLGNELKKVKEENEKLKKSKLTDKEIQELELAEREAQIEEREKQIKLHENKNYALKAIKKAGLDTGDEKAFAIVDFVVADDETTIDERVTAFKGLVDSIVKAEVEATFKKNGKVPDKGNAGNGANNPYAKETWNMTEQMRLEATDPQQAAALKAAAGVK